MRSLTVIFYVLASSAGVFDAFNLHYNRQHDTCDRCPGDVVFLIEDSSSIGPINFNQSVKPFMANLSLGLEIASAGTHLGLIHFSDPGLTATDFHLTVGTSQPYVHDYIMNMPFLAGGTALFTAFSQAEYDVYAPGRGARRDEWGKTTAAYAIVITDGIATDGRYGNASEVTYQMLNDGVAVYAVGVGSLVTPEYLYSLTWAWDRVYNVEDFTNLNKMLVDQILNDTCCPMNFTKPIPPEPPTYCDAIDLIFLLDESGSVNQQDPNNFDTLKEFMINLTDMFTINLYRNTRVAAVGYGDSPMLHFNLYDPGDKGDLHNRIKSMAYLGGARNTTAGLDVILKEVVPYSRAPYNPVYLIHVAEYAHDVGADPYQDASSLGRMGVTIFGEDVLAYRPDAIFINETKGIIASAGGQGQIGGNSRYFNASTYYDLRNSGIMETFREILDEHWSCKNYTTTAAP